MKNLIVVFDNIRIPNFLYSLSSLVIFAVSAVALLAFRMVKLEKIQYGFLAWNLFLAWIPLFVSIGLFYYQTAIKKLNIGVLASGLIVWLLFLPNAPYIITDLLHLNRKMHPHIPIWYDALMIFSFAFAGLLAGFYSLYFVQQLLNQYLKAKTVWLLIGICLGLTGYGLYIGRVLRWNSWDIITNPFDLIESVLHHLTDTYALKFACVYAFILSALYLVFWQMFRGDKSIA
jgi:uncharacterized membrane protein